MKKYILHIAMTLLALLMVSGVWGQTIEIGGNINPGTYSGTLKLKSNTQINKGTIGCISNKELTIDLNGFTLKRTGDSGFILSVNGGKLTIKDSKGGGKISGGRGDRGGCALITGTLILENGTIEDCVSTDSDYAKIESDDIHTTTQGCGGAFFINQGSKFIMNGGAIKNCSTYIKETKKEGTYSDGTKANVWGLGGAVFVDAESGSNPGVFEMNGGIISGCSASYGGAVYVHKSLNKTGNKVNGSFVMNNGEITDNKAYIHGPGVYVAGTFEMKGGSIVRNKPATLIGGWSVPGDSELPSYGGTEVHGGGVYTKGVEGSDALFTMTGGTISDNVAASGGGVMVYTNSAFTMNGNTAKITGNYAAGFAEGNGLGNGGAVYVQEAVFNFLAGELSYNKAVRYGGAVNINASSEDSESILSLKGECRVIGNMANHGGGLSQEQGECNMNLSNSGIELKDNIAKGNGGGLFIEKGKLTIGEGVTISGNKAGLRGGGAALYVERITGNIEANIEGNIENNTSGESGGGIDLFADIANTIKNEVKVNLKKGLLKNNTAPNGAGIYIGINEENSSASMIVGTSTETPIIEGNVATSNGGGIGMSNGSISVENGEFKNNKAGNGGAIYLGSGQFTVKNEIAVRNNEASSNGGGIFVGGGSFNVEGNAVIENNKALSGAGVCVKNGTVELQKGSINYNTASELGGGLYVFNEGSKRTSATFSGGTFQYNTAKAGGAICASGLMDLTLAANLSENMAENGGGIYMANGVNMSFGQGLIVANRAESSVTSKFTTAKNGTSSSVSGVGGGIFMAQKTTLSFTETNSLGIYNNDATNAAADIFASGDGTTINLPNVENMNLKGFDVPASKLYWVEDFMTGDTGYNNLNGDTGGTAVRYNVALTDLSYTINWLKFGSDETSKVISKYACLDLGYDLVFIKLMAIGLSLNDYASIQVSYKDKNDGTLNAYHKILFTGVGDNRTVEKEIGLPSGEWNFSATDWMTEKFDVPTFNPQGTGENELIWKIDRDETTNHSISVIFNYLTDDKKKYIIESYKRVVNYMR